MAVEIKNVAVQQVDEAADRELLLDCISEGMGHLDICNLQIGLLVDEPERRESLDALFRSLHAIKGVAGFMALREVEDVAHAAEDLLCDAREGELVLRGPAMDSLRDTARILETLFQQLADNVDQPTWAPPSVPETEILLIHLDKVRRQDSIASEAFDSPVMGDDVEIKYDRPVISGEAAKTRITSPGIRVEESQLDTLLDALENLSEQQHLLVGAFEAMDREGARQHLNVLTEKIQKARSLGADLRLVSLHRCFSRMARLAYKVGDDTGKRIRVLIGGEETVLDRELADAMLDPLTHIVRNAIDHGLEAEAEERFLANKIDLGTITLDAFQKDNVIHIVVEDDGIGMDRVRIGDAAVARGVVESYAGLTDEEVFQLICWPGFSTKAEATALSGRGVGMDIVKRQVLKVGGSLHISSTLGRGSRFCLQFPML